MMPAAKPSDDRSRPRVLYAPRNISGQAWEYAQGSRALGCEAEVWSWAEPAFGYPVDRVIDKASWLRDPGYRWDVVDEAVRRFDVFHLQYSSSLLLPGVSGAPDLWDVPLLKAMGKRVFMHFRGSDVRLRSMHFAREPDSYFLHSGLEPDEERIRLRISVCRRYCDAMFVSTPGLLDYVPDAVWIPHAIAPGELATERRSEPAVPIVAHAPSRRGTKGSDTVDAVLTSLAEDGVCHYRPLSGLEHADLRSELARVDIVVDSIGIGDHGLISVEAMATGAIAVGHIHPVNRARNPGVPVVEATSETLAQVISDLASSPDRRAALRVEGRDWVRVRHDRDAIGRTLVDFYRQPVREPDLGIPGWPSPSDERRVAALESEVERLRAREVSRALATGGGASSVSREQRPVVPLRERLRRRATANRGMRRAARAIRRVARG